MSFFSADGEKNINKITILNIISTVTLQGLSFIASPIISRMLGPENYGIAAVYITWVGLFSTTFGLQTQSTIALARKDFGLEKQESYQSSILALSLLTYILFSALVLIFATKIASVLGVEKYIVFLMLIQGAAQFVVTFVNVKFTYEFKAPQNFLLTVGVSATTLALSIVLINWFPKDVNYLGRIMGQMIPYTLIAIILIIYIFGTGRSLFNRANWLYCLPLCIPIVFHSLSNLVLNQSDRVMIQILDGNTSAGIYSLAYSFGTVLATVWTAFNNSWVPFYYEYSKKQEFDVLRIKSKNYIELFTVVSIGFLMLFTEVYHIYAGSDYWEGTQLISIFAFGFYCMFLYSFPVNYEFYSKKTSLIAIGTVLSAAINIVLNYYLIRSFGIYGAAFATAISYALQFVFHFISASIISKSSERFPYSFTDFLPGIAIYGIATIMQYYLINAPFIRWGIAITIGFLEIIKIIKRKSIF